MVVGHKTFYRNPTLIVGEDYRKACGQIDKDLVKIESEQERLAIGSLADEAQNLWFGALSSVTVFLLFGLLELLN